MRLNWKTNSSMNFAGVRNFRNGELRETDSSLFVRRRMDLVQVNSDVNEVKEAAEFFG